MVLVWIKAHWFMVVAGQGDDLSRGFYTSREALTAISGAEKTVFFDSSGGGRVVLAFELDTKDVGTIVDIGPGGAHSRMFQEFLAEKGLMKAFETESPDSRGAVIEYFLSTHGLTPSVIFGRLYTGPTQGNLQEVIRDPVAASKLILVGAEEF